MMLYLVMKRLFDIIISSFLLIILLPLLIIITILVKALSKGPSIYLGERTGINNTRFYIFKFRTMFVGSDKLAGTTSRNDSRVTSIGKWLRRYKLDELPQLCNVLLGHMSIVGPRPELPLYTEKYTALELKILSVKPGITDFASIEFHNLGDLIDDEDPDGSFERKFLSKKNQLRLKYIKKQNFLVDIIIIIRTIKRLIIK